MKISVNSKDVETSAANIAALVTELNLPNNGIAIASDNVMIPRTQWEKTPVKENMRLIIIKAACGG
ncbi:MAG: sulfur carrier protein ThiS [Bacteroidales bacterium]|nr:sulfur carrier protein ThiS [Bacteroidales bacterium]